MNRSEDIRMSIDAKPSARDLQGIRADGLLHTLRRVLGLEVKRSPRSLAIVETLALGGRCQLVLVSCGLERYLVGVGADSVNSLVHMATLPPVDGQRCGSEDRSAGVCV